MAKIPRVSSIFDRQGNKKSVGKPNNSPLPSSLLKSSHSSCVDGNLRVLSGLPAGTTMKKLLTDEMKTESESGRRPPSIIANLMGLDWLPALHNAATKQNKRHSDDYQKKCDSGVFVRRGKGNESRSHRKHGKEQQRCGDVYEVSERSNMETRSTTSHASSFRNGNEDDEIAFVRQKFIDVKRLSTDEKLRHSKEFHDALEVLDSNKDLLLKFLQEPNSLFTKHLKHLHGTREQPCGFVEGMKSSNTLKGNVDMIGYHSGGKTSEKIDISHPRDDCNERHFNLNSRRNVGSRKLNISSEGKEDALSIATQIVVLKPNLGKARNTVRSVSSTRTTTPSRDLVSYNEFHDGRPNEIQLGSEMMDKRSTHEDLEFCSIKSRESREIARDVTRKMKNRLGGDSFNVSSYGYKGYSADESSSEMSENDSLYESDVMILGSTSSSNRRIRSKASVLPHTESSINTEAKKRLSRIWNMSHKSQEIGASVKGSTLADMLAIPDVDVRPHNVDYGIARDDRIRKMGRDDETIGSTTPFGISSRDGWKDGSVWNSSRLRSHSASSSQQGSPKSSTMHETITAERFLVRARSSDRGKNKSFKRESERKDASFPENTKSKNNEYQSTCEDIIDDIDVPSKVNLVTNSIDGKASPDVKSVIIEIPSSKHVPLSAVVDTEYNSVSKSLNCPDELFSESTAQSSFLPYDDQFNHDLSSEQQDPSTSYNVVNSSCLKFSDTQTKSSTSSKESEQPSPVSVLEAPFAEEVSSGSECFERVSADLHGLRMQLKLLKQESEVYDEGSMLISSDECEEESTELDDKNGLHWVDESWESSYLLDVLAYSGLDETNHDVFLETWHSPNCPIGPWVFDNLEKKYGKWKLCLRSERKLLFDRINAGIMRLFSQYVDIGPWLKPLGNVGHQQWKVGLKTELHYLLKNHEKVAIGNVMDAAILGEMKWFKPGDHLDVVGSDIERSLIDELATEFLSL